MLKTTIILARHGEVEAPAGVLYSQKDVSLTEKGVLQAKKLANALSDIPINRVISSDLKRCANIAHEVALLHDISPELTPCFRELDFGLWSGFRWDEIKQKWPVEAEKRIADMENYRPPCGENLQDMLERSWPIFKQIAHEELGNTVCFVAHGGLNRALISKAVGLPVSNCFNLAQELACFNIIDYYQDGIFVLKALNLSVDYATHYFQTSLNTTKF